MVGGNARLQSGENKYLLIAANLEDRTAAVAHVKILIPIKRDSCCDPHTLGIGGHGSVWRHAIHRAIMARRNIHLSLAVEGDGGRVHHLRDERLHRVIGIDLEDRNRNLLPARPRKCGVDIALRVDRRTGDWMQILGDRDRHLHVMRVAHMPVGGDDTGPEVAPSGTRATRNESELTTTPPSTSPNCTRGRCHCGGRNPEPAIRTSPPASASTGDTDSICGPPFDVFVAQDRSENPMRNMLALP